MAAQAALPSKLKVTNITRKLGGAGKFLDPGSDFGNVLIAPGKSMLFTAIDGTVPPQIQYWVEKGYVSVHNAATGDLLHGEIASGEITPGNISPVREATAPSLEKSDIDALFDEEPDLNDALEAVMPEGIEGTGPIKGDIRQLSQPPIQRAKVSMGRREEEVIGGELSPIPGDRPRNLDDTEKFTVRAPRSHAVGGVISSGKK